MKFSEAFDAMMAGKRISLPALCSPGTFPPDWWLSLAQGEPSPATGGKSEPYIAEHKAAPFRASGPDYSSRADAERIEKLEERVRAVADTGCTNRMTMWSREDVLAALRCTPEDECSACRCAALLAKGAGRG